MQEFQNPANLLGLVAGLVAMALLLPALLLLCGTRQKDVPVGPSMANRRGGAGGKAHIDPLLQPSWAKQQAEMEAQKKQQLAVVMAGKARKNSRRASGGDSAMHVMLRQPSTMADRYALPTHLTKQLGQSSRRPGAGSGTGPSPAPHPPGSQGSARLDGSLNGPPSGAITGLASPQLLTRPERAYTESPAAARSPLATSSIQLRTETDSQRGSNASASYRRRGAGSGNGDGSLAAGPSGLRELSADLLPLAGSIALPPKQGSASGMASAPVAWATLAEDSVDPIDLPERDSTPFGTAAAIATVTATVAPPYGKAAGGGGAAAPPAAPSTEDEVEQLVRGIDWNVTHRGAASAASGTLGDAVTAPAPTAVGPPRLGAPGVPSRSFGRTASNHSHHSTASHQGLGGRAYLPSPLGSRSSAQEHEAGHHLLGAASSSGMHPYPHTSSSASASVPAVAPPALLPGSISGTLADGVAHGPGPYPQRGAYSTANVLQSSASMRARGVSLGAEAAGGGAEPGGGGGGSAAGSRMGTFSGMAGTGVQMFDIEAGPGGLVAAAAMGAAGTGADHGAYHGSFGGSANSSMNSGVMSSRAARAQAMLARNMSRLAMHAHAAGEAA